MANRFDDNVPQRRYVRVAGPFEACHLGAPEAPVLIYDLNLGGGFVNFIDARPDAPTMTLKIDLPNEGPIIVNAETVYRHQYGTAVRFVDVDSDVSARLNRSITRLYGWDPDTHDATTASGDPSTRKKRAKQAEKKQ